MPSTSTVRVLTAIFVAVSASITPALSYYPSDFGKTDTSRPSRRIEIYSSSMSSSSASSLSSRQSSSVVSLRASSRSSTSKKDIASSVSAITKERLMAECLIEAIERRETVIRDSLDLFYSDMSKLLDTRKSTLLVIMKQGDPAKQQNAVKSIWRGFGQAWRLKAVAMREERRAAWERYRTDRYECGYVGHDLEMGGYGLDSQY